MVALGRPSCRWAAPERGISCMGGVFSDHVHYSPIIGGIHVTRLGSRCSLSRSIRSDLSWTPLLDTQSVSQTCMEPRATEQAISGHRCPVERMGCGCAILALRLPS